MGAPMRVRLMVPLWVINATPLPVAAIVEAIPASVQSADVNDEAKPGAGGEMGASSGLPVIDTGPPPSPRLGRWAPPASLHASLGLGRASGYCLVFGSCAQRCA